jgi:APA family basic amino acid/polyamine antiporter
MAAIGLQAAIAIFMVITASFEKLLIYIGFTLSLSSMFTVAGLILLRQRSRLRAEYKTPGYPLVPALFILGNLGIVLYSLAASPQAPLLGLATIGLGLLIYLAFKNGAHGQRPN